MLSRKLLKGGGVGPPAVLAGVWASRAPVPRFLPLPVRIAACSQGCEQQLMEAMCYTIAHSADENHVLMGLLDGTHTDCRTVEWALCHD